MTLIYSPSEIKSAAECLAIGGCLAYPTEAVFGLGVDPRSEEAVERLFRIKGRDRTKGVLLIASDFSQLADYVDLEAVPMYRQLAISRTWPGPHSWVFPATQRVPAWLAGAHEGIGVRVTAHGPAAALCGAFGGPIVSTSANRQGVPPARSVAEVLSQFGNELDGVLDAPIGRLTRPTPIRSAMDGSVVRP